VAAVPGSEQLAFTDSRYEFRAVLLLALGFGLVGLDRWLVTPLAPEIMRDLHLDYQDLGNLGAAVGLSWGLFAIIMGRMADRFGRRRIVIPAVVAFSLLSGVSGLATGFASLFLARLLMGIAEGAYCPSSYAAALDASAPRRRGVNLGIIQGAFALFGLALGPILATQLVSITGSWRQVFVLISLPGLLLAAILAKVLRDPPRNVRRDRPGRAYQSWIEVLRYRNVRVAMLAIFASMSGIFVIGVMAPVFLIDVIGLAPETMGFVMSGFGFGGFFGQILLGALSDRVGRRPALVLAFVIGALALAGLVSQPSAPAMLFALLFAAAFCCCDANALLAGPIPGESVPPAMASSAMGATIGLGEIFGGGVAPSLGGFIAKHAGLPMAFMSVAGLLMAGACAALLLRRPEWQA